MRSIQFQLTVWLAAVMVILSIAGGGSLVAWLRHAMLAEFDRSLTVRAHTLQSLVTQTSDGKLDVDVDLRPFKEFTGPAATEYFQFQDAAGRQIASSDQRGLSRAAALYGRPWDTSLPDGAAARALQIWFDPAVQDEDDEQRSIAANRTGTRVALQLTVARSRQPLDLLLRHVTLGVAGATAVFSTVAVIASVWIVGRGLYSLRRLAAKVQSVRFHQTAHTASDLFETSELPRELRPIALRLNEVLERMYHVVARERHFNAAVSHELRTPIAELRSVADITLREPDNLLLHQRAVRQTLEIALQMQTMLATLLAISSSERPAEEIVCQPVRLCDCVDRALRQNESLLAQRRISVEYAAPSGACVNANQPLLDAVCDNLINNAARYARSESLLKIFTSEDAQRVTLRFENQQDSLSSEEIEHVFDPFWRKDAARSGGQHVGLGLTLVRAYCNAMNSSVQATLNDDNRFCVEIGLPHPEPVLPNHPQLQASSIGVIA